MKVIALAIGLLGLADGAAVARSKGSSFGPEHCVKLSRSSEGSCVITTDCENADISKTEFAFDCVAHDGVVRHSFGAGGFENSEEFDTEVKCDKCESISAADVLAKVAAVAPVPQPKAATPSTPKHKLKVEVPEKIPGSVVFKAKAKVEVKTEAKTEAKAGFWPFTGESKFGIETKKDPEITRYGPDGCVSAWKNADGHCIIKTNCKKSDISKYDFGLVCVDKVGAPVRHLFGKDSFDREETFDTLIKCDKCMGLEDIPDAVALNGEVMTISQDIQNLKAVMKNISINVNMLNKEVFKSAEKAPAAAAPAPAAVAEAPAPAAAASLIHESATVVSGSEAKHNLRRSHKKHHAKRHEEDDEDDEYDDDGNERGSDVEKAVTSDDEDEDDEKDDDGDDED